MKSLLQSMFLTVVILALNSGAWAAEVDKDKPATTKTSSSSIDYCSNEKRAELQAAKDAADAEVDDANTNLSNARTGDKPDKKEMEKFTNIVSAKKKAATAAASKLEFCKNLKNECKEYKDEAAKITKDFSYPAQIRALKCLAEDQDEGDGSGSGVGKAVLRAMAGQITQDTKSACRPDSGDENYRKRYEKKEKLIEDNEKEYHDTNEKLLKSQKQFAEDQKRLEEQRQDLKEAWEKKQTDQEAQQQRALNAMKENQLKIQEQVRKSNAELIVARQDQAKSERKRAEELAKSGLQSSQSVIRICEAQAREYIKKMGYDKKKVKTSGSGAIGSGKKKKDDVNSVVDDCIKQAEERRAGIYQDFENYQVQLINNIQIREQQLSELEGEFKRQYEDYTKAIEREQGSMTKAYANYIQKDQQLAKAIQEAMQSQNTEMYNLNMKKQGANQKIYGAQTSLGEIGEEEAELLMSKNEEYTDLLAKMEAAGCADSTAAKIRSNSKQYRDKVEEYRSNK